MPNNRCDLFSNLMRASLKFPEFSQGKQHLQSSCTVGLGFTVWTGEVMILVWAPGEVCLVGTRPVVIF